MNNSPKLNTEYSPIVHGFAQGVSVVTFFLIFAGGLVTTQDAGMSVPDWPTTFGYNMFAYPISTWIAGPFDLFVEHAHRLLATAVGILAICLLCVSCYYDERRWFKVWTGFILLVVIGQGSLGGIRVTMDERTFAKIHGCIGPMFFACTIATCVFCSRWWKGLHLESRISKLADEKQHAMLPTRFGFGGWLLSMLPLLAILQLVIGAQLRHVKITASPHGFYPLVHMHLGLAAILVIAIISAFVMMFFGRLRRTEKLRGAATGLVLLVLCQVALGCAAWVANYALPWISSNQWFASYTIAAQGWWETLLVTGHQATGSLIIGASTAMAVRLWGQVIVNRKLIQPGTANEKVNDLDSSAPHSSLQPA